MTQLLIAGTGLIGHRHLAHIEEHPDLELAGIVDPDPDRRRHPTAPGFDRIEDVDVSADGIIIATPTDTHCALAEAAFEKGLHVLVEKPIAETLEETDRMIAASKAAGKHLLVGHHRRHHPHVAKLKNLLSDGHIGQPVVAQLIWCMRKPDDYFDIPWRAGMNGAPVKQNLIHEVDTLRWLFGDIVEVIGLGSNAIRQAERTESGGAILRFSSGCLVTIAFADTTPTPWGFEAGTGESPAIPHTAQDCLRISGTKGGIEFPSLRVWSGAETWNDRPVAKDNKAPPGVPLVRQLEHFADVITGRAPPLVTGQEGRASLAATLQIEQATLPASMR